LKLVLDKITPDIFKIGILTPVLKKAKNPMIMDNYRGITVTPTVSKIFETTI
jgi:flagellar hook-length control protein FliK